MGAAIWSRHRVECGYLAVKRVDFFLRAGLRVAPGAGQLHALLRCQGNESVARDGAPGGDRFRMRGSEVPTAPATFVSS